MISPDLSTYISHFNIERGLISSSVELLTSGKCNNEKQIFKPHHNVNNCYVIIVKAEMVRNSKGNISVVDPKDFKGKVPDLTPDMLKYMKMTYSGNNIWVCPKHVEVGKKLHSGELKLFDITACLLIVKGKGVIITSL